jgi:hypothetical protein
LTAFVIDVDILTDIAVGNDKPFTVPTAATAPPKGRIWELLYGRVELTTTATVGNRQLTLQVETAGGDVLYLDDATATTPASQTDVAFLIGDDPVLPTNRSIWLPAGAVVRLWDSADIDALDTLKVWLVVREHIETEI